VKKAWNLPSRAFQCVHYITLSMGCVAGTPPGRAVASAPIKRGSVGGTLWGGGFSSVQLVALLALFLDITETNRIHSVLIGMQNRTFVPMWQPLIGSSFHLWEGGSTRARRSAGSAAQSRRRRGRQPMLLPGVDDESIDNDVSDVWFEPGPGVARRPARRQPPSWQRVERNEEPGR
jgi:hypothetical protein